MWNAGSLVAQPTEPPGRQAAAPSGPTTRALMAAVLAVFSVPQAAFARSWAASRWS